MAQKKLIIRLISTILAGGLMLAPAFGFTSTDKGSREMVLDGGKTGPVPFNHHLHQDRVNDCQACHRDFPQQPGALNNAKAAGRLKKKQVMNKTCIKCHRAQKKAGEPFGPVSCKGCHQK